MKSDDLTRAMAELVEKQLVPLRDEVASLRSEVAALRADPTSEPVGLREAARMAGVSADTMYQHAERYGGWKVDPSKPKSQWRFDPDRVRHAAGAAVVATPPGAHRRRSTVELLPVKDRAA